MVLGILLFVVVGSGKCFSSLVDRLQLSCKSSKECNSFGCNHLIQVYPCTTEAVICWNLSQRGRVPYVANTNTECHCTHFLHLNSCEGTQHGKPIFEQLRRTTRKQWGFGRNLSHIHHCLESSFVPCLLLRTGFNYVGCKVHWPILVAFNEPSLSDNQGFL